MSQYSKGSGLYETPFGEVLDVIQEQNFLQSGNVSADYNPTPHWGDGGQSGSDLGGNGSSNIRL